MNKPDKTILNHLRGTALAVATGLVLLTGPSLVESGAIVFAKGEGSESSSADESTDRSGRGSGSNSGKEVPQGGGRDNNNGSNNGNTGGGNSNGSNSGNAGSGNSSGSNNGNAGSGNSSGSNNGNAGGGNSSGSNNGNAGGGNSSGSNNGNAGGGNSNGSNSGNAGGGNSNGSNSGNAGGGNSNESNNGNASGGSESAAEDRSDRSDNSDERGDGGASLGKAAAPGGGEGGAESNSPVLLALSALTEKLQEGGIDIRDLQFDDIVSVELREFDPTSTETVFSIECGCPPVSGHAFCGGPRRPYSCRTQGKDADNGDQIFSRSVILPTNKVLEQMKVINDFKTKTGVPRAARGFSQSEARQVFLGSVGTTMLEDLARVTNPDRTLKSN